MPFLAIVLALLVYQWRGSLPRLQRDEWYRDWVERVRTGGLWFAHGHGRLLVSLGVPVVGLALALHWFGDGLFGLVALTLNLLVLFYAFGRCNLRQQVGKLRADLDRGDLQAAYHDAANFNPQRREGLAEDAHSLGGEIVEYLSYRYLERHFAVIFWFVLAGAPGALLYRLVAIDQPLDAAEVARQARWLRLLEWLPVRLLGFALALAGNFRACFDQWLNLLFGAQTSSELLRAYVPAALAEERVGDTLNSAGIYRIEALFFRALLCWLVVIALAVIFV